MISPACGRAKKMTPKKLIPKHTKFELRCLAMASSGKTPTRSMQPCHRRTHGRDGNSLYPQDHKSTRNIHTCEAEKEPVVLCWCVAGWGKSGACHAQSLNQPIHPKVEESFFYRSKTMAGTKTRYSKPVGVGQIGNERMVEHQSPQGAKRFTYRSRNVDNVEVR